MLKIIEAIKREKSLLSLIMSKDARKLLQEVNAVAEHNNEQLVDLVNIMSVSSVSMESNFHELTDKISDVHTHQLGL
jgi:hypothetical protein